MPANPDDKPNYSELLIKLQAQLAAARNLQAQGREVDWSVIDATIDEIGKSSPVRIGIRRPRNLPRYDRATKLW